MVRGTWNVLEVLSQSGARFGSKPFWLKLKPSLHSRGGKVLLWFLLFPFAFLSAVP